jgi:hypothetical protein
MNILASWKLLLLLTLALGASHSASGDEKARDDTAREGTARESTVWWSLRSPTRPDLPPNDDWCVGDIDRFVLTRLRQRDLEPSGRADGRTLIRRLYLVMLGVPPSPEEIESFVADAAPDSWSQLVDRVLEDPRYGERWAQHWLDVIRWAETTGFETNLSRPKAWPYRDWVIRSLNADKPYDRFVFEQIAGDTVGEDAALGFLVAGPCNLEGQIGEDEKSIRQARQDELDEVIGTVSQSILGLTTQCARCHDHKFDPILQRDYYAMQAVFAGLRYGPRRLRGEENDAWAAKAPGVARRVEALRVQLESKRAKHELRTPLANVQEESFAPTEIRRVRMKIQATATGGNASLFEFQVWTAKGDGESRNVALASAGGSASASSFALENQTRHPDNLIDGELNSAGIGWPWKARTAGAAWVEISLREPAVVDRIVWHSGHGTPVDYEIEAQSSAGEWKSVAHTRDRFPRGDDRRSADKVRLEGVSAKDVAEILRINKQLASARAEHARLSAGPQVFGAMFVSPDPIWLLERGDPMRRLDRVKPDVPAALGSRGSLGSLELDLDAGEAERRVALARHLTRRDHPLTSRVIVNRIWHHHFGRGLVLTPSDFGKMGARPSHPELLDWLAIELVDKAWSLKALHRTILRSATFRQSSRPRSEAIDVDSDSRLLWRFPPRRVEAEVLRDSILTASGSLSASMFGAGFDFFRQKGGLSDYHSHEIFDESGWRRMIYATKIRMQAVDIFSAFDCPDAGQMTSRRNRSVTSLQALSLLNSPFANRHAKLFAERVEREEKKLDRRVARAVRIAFGRSPDADEAARLSKLSREFGLEAVCRVLLNTSEFIRIP